MVLFGLQISEHQMEEQRSPETCGKQNMSSCVFNLGVRQYSLFTSDFRRTILIHFLENIQIVSFYVIM